MRRFFLLLTVIAIAPPDLHAACTVHSAAEHTHLVELYSAEGCSSCPPAEHWLSTLRESTQYIGLEFHVDYWDDQGWRDPFADPRYTARQRALVRHDTRGIIYTPQIAVDGSVWKDWPKAAPPSPAQVAPIGLTLEAVIDDAVRAKVATHSSAALPAGYRFYLALSENGLTSSVRAGENRGKQLDHDMVVRDLAGPLPLPQAQAVLQPPHDFDLAKSAVVAFVEDTKSGDIVQAVRLPLAQCKP